MTAQTIRRLIPALLMLDRAPGCPGFKEAGERLMTRVVNCVDTSQGSRQAQQTEEVSLGKGSGRTNILEAAKKASFR